MEHISEADAADKNPATAKKARPISIRVSPGSYFTALFILTFISSFILYLAYDIAGTVLLVFGSVLLACLAYMDRIVFDGRRLCRTGLIPRTWARMNGMRDRLKLSDIEQVETQAVRSIKRGGSVIYRYRTSVRGKGVVFTMATGGSAYRQMVKSVLPLLPENVLDNRSLELRDYLTERSEALRKAQFSNIPSTEVLESSLYDLRSKEKRPMIQHPAADVNGEADSLRKLANELRIAGLLLQALETFRRAARLRPKDAWLLFEFARCMQSFAGSQRDRNLERKAVALMRLSEKRAGNDGALLARLGEAYFQSGEWERAGAVFRRAIDGVGESFRTLRGMAEIALREGKIAHVIHNFAAANRLAETPALRRWTQAEVDYFSRLNEDDEYMEMEFSRVNLLDTLESIGRTALRMAFLSFPLIAVGVLFDDGLVANIGWAVSGIALFIWVGIIFLRRLLSPRIPFDLVRGD